MAHVVHRSAQHYGQRPRPACFESDDRAGATRPPSTGPRIRGLLTATQSQEHLGLDVHVLPSLADQDVAQFWAAAFDLVAGEAQVFSWCADDDALGASLLAQEYVIFDDDGVSGWMHATDAPPYRRSRTVTA